MDSSESVDFCSVKTKIVSLIHEYLVMTQLFSVEKTKTALRKIKLKYPDRFDICLHNLINSKILAVRKVKFHLRKFIQELFHDMSAECLFIQNF